MEIKYMRTYAPKGKRYSLGEMPVALGYAMEIIEPRPRLAEGRLNPGEMCMMLFAITPEEYALKDTNAGELDSLAEKLGKNVPGDRLLAWLVRDLKGALVKSDAKPQLGESIDGGELMARVKEKQRQAAAGPIDAQLQECRRLQGLCRAKDAPEGVKADWKSAREALGRMISELDSIFVAYDALLNDRWPAVGFDNRVEIFTTRLRGEAAEKQVTKANGGVKLWTLKEIASADMEIFFRQLENNGLYELRVENGFASADLNLTDFRKVKAEENAPLRSMMLREIAYGMRWNTFKQSEGPERSKVGALESMLSLRNFVWHTAGKGLLYAACDVPAGDERLCTPAAKERLGQADLQTVIGERCLSLKNKQSGQMMLAVFTTSVQAVAFCERIGSGARPVVMTFDDIVQRAVQCEGIVIDPESFSYRIMKQDFDKIKEMREKPPVIVRVKPPEPAKPEPVKNEPAAEEADMGSLPDPDAVQTPAQKEDIARQPIEPEQPAGEDENPGKKGFFRRLFGK